MLNLGVDEAMMLGDVAVRDRVLFPVAPGFLFCLLLSYISWDIVQYEQIKLWAGLLQDYELCFFNFYLQMRILAAVPCRVAARASYPKV